MAIMAAHVGLDPKTDFDWVPSPDNPMEVFAEGKADAFLAFPPEPQELRASNVGRQDDPGQPMVAVPLLPAVQQARTSFATTRSRPSAICVPSSRRPTLRRRAGKGVATLGPSGLAVRYALQTLTEIRYRKWRNYDPEDTMRFYALRLHEAGMIRTSPKQILAEGTDWRFLNELKRELKA